MSELKELLTIAKFIAYSKLKHFKDYKGDVVCVGDYGKIYHVDEIHDLFRRVRNQKECLAFQKEFEYMIAVSYDDETENYILKERLRFDEQDIEYLYKATRLENAKRLVKCDGNCLDDDELHCKENCILGTKYGDCKLWGREDQILQFAKNYVKEHEND